MDTKVKIYQFRPYSFTDENSGELVQGVKAFYVNPNNELNGEDGSYGLESGYVNLPYSTKSKFMGCKLPCEATFVIQSMGLGKKNKVVDIKF